MERLQKRKVKEDQNQWKTVTLNLPKTRFPNRWFSASGFFFLIYVEYSSTNLKIAINAMIFWFTLMVIPSIS